MADYNAGSIEGTVTVNTDPFLAGLALAQSQADAFEDDDIEKTVHVKTEQTGDQNAKEPGVHDETAKISLDDDEFQAKLKKDILELDEVGLKKETATITINTNAAIANARKLEREIDNLIGDGAGEAHAIAKGGEGGGGGHGMLYLIGLAAALAPALGPATAALGLFASAGVAGFAALAVGGLAWAKVASKAFEQIQNAIKAGKQLPGVAGQAETAFEKLSAGWDSFQKKVDPAIFRVMVQAFNTLSGLLPKLVGPMNAFSQGLGGALKNFSKLFDTKTFSTFLKVFESLSKTELPRLGKIGKNAVQGILNLFIALGPVIDDLTGWLQGVTKEFRQWSGTKADSFVENLYNYVKKFGPSLSKALGDVLKGLGAIGQGLAPLVGPAIALLDGLGKAAQNLKGPLTLVASGLAPVIKALAWILSNKAALYTALSLIGVAILFVGSDFAGVIVVITAFALLAGFIKKHWGDIAAFFTGIWGAIKSGAEAVWNWIQGNWPLLLGILTGPFGLAAAEVVKHWDDVKGFFTKLPGDIKAIFNGAIGWLKDKGRDILNGLKDGASAAWSAVSGWFSDRKSAIQDKFSSAASWLVSHGKDILQGLKSGAVDAWDKVSSWFDGLKDKITGYFTGIDLTDAGKKIVQSLANGIKAGAQAAYDALKGVAKKLAGLIPGSPVKDGPLRVLNRGYAGGKITEMLTDGIKSGAGRLYSTATEVVGGLNDILSGAGSGVALGGGQYKIIGGSVMSKGLSDLSDSVDALSKQMAETTAAVNANGYTVADAVTASSRDHADSVVAGVAAATDKQTTVLVQTARTR